MALAQHALAYAEAMLDAALAHAPDDPVVRIELLQEQNVVFRYSLQFARWRTNLDEQQALLASLSTPDPRLGLEIDLDRSRYFTNTGAGDEAVDAARAAITLAETLDDKTALAHGYRALGNGYWIQTRMAEAGHSFGQSAQYAREAGDRAIEATSLELQAQTGMFSGMPARADFRSSDRRLWHGRGDR